jgi:hypothetical protein
MSCDDAWEWRWEADERESAGKEAELACEEVGEVDDDKVECGEDAESNNDAGNTAERGEGEPI